MLLQGGSGSGKSPCCRTTPILGKEKKNVELKWTVVAKEKGMMKNKIAAGLMKPDFELHK